MAQLVKQPTLDFNSGHDLMVHEFEPRVGLCADSVEPAWDGLSLPFDLSLKINKTSTPNWVTETNMPPIQPVA